LETAERISVSRKSAIGVATTGLEVVELIDAAVAAADDDEEALERQ
jgi:hypothetical protein